MELPEHLAGKTRPPYLSMLMLLPRARRWVRRLLDEHRDARRPVSSFGFQRLDSCWPRERLDASYVVLVEQCPMPTEADLGMEGVVAFEPQRTRGITYLNTFFIRRDAADNESLFFHEMVHVAQWQRLGLNRFLGLYALGLLQAGYRDSPLEQMAYDMQKRFDAGDTFDAEADTIHQTDQLLAAFRRQRLSYRLFMDGLRLIDW
jgi:hypothetical protein